MRWVFGTNLTRSRGWQGRARGPGRNPPTALKPDADAVAYSQQLRTYPLSNANSPGASRYIDAYPKAWHTLPTFDLDYLHLLAQVIDEEPPQDRDAVMLNMLASLGINLVRPSSPPVPRPSGSGRASLRAPRR